MTSRTMVTVVLCCVPLAATWLRMPPVPLDRLVANTKSLILQNPNDPEAHYLLGRLYSLKFAMKTEAGATLSAGKVATLDAYTHEHEPRQSTGRLTATELDNATASLENYKRAVELAPDDPLYHFSLGWMQQQCARFSSQLGTSSQSERIELALAEYRNAYRLALPKDRKTEYQMRAYLSDEAGSAIVEILKGRPGTENEIADINKAINDLRSHPHVITPLVFSLDPRLSLSDLISDRKVEFDLDGFNDGRQWPWVRPGTCILVWDPDRTGRITSGRQLFGSVTWWMFWRNGYEALASLDDNHDGVLSGSELKGISIWRDANSNGIAEAGEVVPAEDFGVIEIAVRAAEVNGTLLQKQGIRMSDRTLLTTFDWIPLSVGYADQQPQSRIKEDFSKPVIFDANNRTEASSSAKARPSFSFPIHFSTASSTSSASGWSSHLPLNNLRTRADSNLRLGGSNE